MLGNAALYYDPGFPGGIVTVTAQMGYEHVTQIQVAGTSMAFNQISERQIGENGEYYQTDEPLQMTTVDDLSLLGL